MSRLAVAATVTAAFLMQITGCTYRSVTVTSDQLREPGIEVIKSITTTNGDTLRFDEMPYTHMARVLGDTIYAYVEGEPVRVALRSVNVISVERVYLILPVKATGDILKDLGTAAVTSAIKLKPMAKQLIPYLIPVVFVLIVVNMEKG